MLSSALSARRRITRRVYSAASAPTSLWSALAGPSASGLIKPPRKCELAGTETLRDRGARLILPTRRVYQRYLEKTLTEKYKSLDVQFEKTVNEANAKIDSMQDQMKGKLPPEAVFSRLHCN